MLDAGYLPYENSVLEDGNIEATIFPPLFSSFFSKRGGRGECGRTLRNRRFINSVFENSVFEGGNSVITIEWHMSAVTGWLFLTIPPKR
jgi:hypothetical protein